MTRQAWLGALISLAVFTVIGALALVVNEPLLLPSLGPTALVQLETPHQPSARPWNTDRTFRNASPLAWMAHQGDVN